MNRALLLTAGLTVLACCMTEPNTAARSISEAGARADLAGADGQSRGTAVLTATISGLMLRVEAQGLAPGEHGIHLHAIGRCDPPDFQTAGPHWNPTAHQHGSDNPQGPHAGDLPNIVIGADGRGSLSAPLAGARLGDLLDSDGAAIVIHANADDYRTDPSGNSGGRIACGVIRAG